MAVFPTYDVDDLAGFSGLDASEYTNTAFVGSALSQATLLFKLGTCLGENWPDDPTMASLAEMAILSMANAIYAAQPFQKVLANPFSSETIGSYSYSKVAGAVMGGLPTGISWFDIAISKLSVCDLNDSSFMGGGHGFFAFDDSVVYDGTNLFGPGELRDHDYWMRHDPSEGYPFTA